MFAFACSFCYRTYTNRYAKHLSSFFFLNFEMSSRERNRVHARNTRERKKSLVDSLQYRIQSLVDEVRYQIPTIPTLPVSPLCLFLLRRPIADIDPIYFSAHAFTEKETSQ